MVDNRNFLLAAGCFCLMIVFPSVMMIIFSFSALKATEWGLNYNSVTLHLDPHPYNTGLHLLGLFHSFYKFPSIYQNMEFSSGAHNLLYTRTHDGLPVTLGISFQYTLQKENLYQLYMNYKYNYPRILFHVASNIIANTASNYSAYNFFNDKATIGVAMHRNLNDYTTLNLFLTIRNVQIMLVELPKSFQDAILQSIAIKQNITRTRKIKLNKQVKFQTEIMAANQTAIQMVTLAAGQAQKILAENNATSLMLKQTLNAQLHSYGLIKSNLNFSSSDLLEYMWWDSLASEQGNSNFIIGLNPSTIIREKITSKTRKKN